jgi:ATP-dependent DNA helicase RecQ
MIHLAIMPTGGGKSIVFTTRTLFPELQIAHRHRFDQVDSLKANGIEACFINSSQTKPNSNYTLKPKRQ